MDNFMFQKLMTSKEKEEETMTEDSKEEVLNMKETTTSFSKEDIAKEEKEVDQERYTARKTLNH